MAGLPAYVGNPTSPHVKRTDHPTVIFRHHFVLLHLLYRRVCILFKVLKMTNRADEELVASKTEGFKVGEKKTLEEYAKLGKKAFTV